MEIRYVALATSYNKISLSFFQLMFILFYITFLKMILVMLIIITLAIAQIITYNCKKKKKRKEKKKNLSSTPDYNLNDHKWMNEWTNKCDLQNIAEGKISEQHF